MSARGLRLMAPGRPAPVLDGAALALAPGEHVALMGPSGIGKSSLIEAIARLRPCEGEILIDGRPLADWDEAAARPDRADRPEAAADGRHHRPEYPPGLSTGLGRGAARGRKARASPEFTERQPLGLDTVLGGRGQGLSGGQAQRVALARLFLRDPGLILLDEPTAHLDEDTQARVLDEILTFAAGRTLLIATHSPQVAARFGRTLRLADGKLEQA